MGIATWEQEMADYGVHCERQGRAEERERMNMLVAKMKDAGVGSDEIVAALSGPDMDAVFAEYGV